MKKERLIYLSFTVLVLVASITLFRKEKSVLSIENKRYWISKSYSEETFPVVMAGDSRVFRGLSPEAFEEAYPGMSAINLGYSSNGFHPIYMDFLEGRLDKNAKDPVIVLGISAYSFSRNGSGSYSYRAEASRKKEEVIQYMNFYRLSKLFAPLNILETTGMAEKNNWHENYYIKYHFDGWMESYWVRPDTSYSDQFYKVIFKDNKYFENAVGVLSRQIRIWTDEGINVVAFRTPTTQSIRMLEDSLSGFEIEPFKKELIENGAQWIEIDRRDYQTYDGNHLESESAVKLSRDLAKEIRRIIES